LLRLGSDGLSKGLALREVSINFATMLEVVRNYGIDIGEA
jgi:hypothetical protein